MSKNKFALLIAFMFAFLQSSYSTQVDLTVKWNAYWIDCPSASPFAYGVYHFRKNFKLTDKPEKFILNVSADNRYRLFINGTEVSQGPARGDLMNWYYESVDVGKYLNIGNNTIAAIVWNMGEFRPLAQITNRTGLIVQSNAVADSIVNTNDSWKVIQNHAYSPITKYNYFVGATDSLVAAKNPWGWERQDYNDSRWENARQLERGTPYGSGTGYSWVLTPRDIPPMEDQLQRMSKVRRAEGIKISADWPNKTGELIIPAHKKANILLDQEVLTTGYPVLLVSGGKNARLKMSYAEALYRDSVKGNRNEVNGYEMIKAPSDYIIADGGKHRLFRPLWFRTWRYVQLEIETADEALHIEDFYAHYSSYPFQQKASFESNDKSLEQIWQTGWRTARLCAQETYFDCPYYEQLQYIGDTRIQALISLYVSGDDRLMKKAIRDFNRSRTYEGITDSRFPGYKPQFIPPFSLFWINMVRDHWMHKGDAALIKECLPGIKSVLYWFENKIDPRTGMLGALPHWNFVDWAKPWVWSNEKPLGGVPPGGLTGGSSTLTLQLAYTLRDACALLYLMGENELANHYTSLHQSLIKAVKKNCWDVQKGLFADDINHTSFSQHANIMAVLSDALPLGEEKALFDKIVSDTNLIQATLYYRFYLFRAMRKVGRGNDYINMLQPWKDMLALGLTTFAEKPEPTRSDCHAWSASPNYDLLSTVCGIEPASPGFKTVRIEPCLGELNFVKAKMPHPAGTIALNFSKSKKAFEAEVILPDGLKGVFIYQGREQNLYPGNNILKYDQL